MPDCACSCGIAVRLNLYNTTFTRLLRKYEKSGGRFESLCLFISTKGFLGYRMASLLRRADGLIEGVREYDVRTIVQTPLNGMVSSPHSQSRTALHNAAISENSCRGNVTGGGAGEKCDETANFFGLGHSSERNRAVEFFQQRGVIHGA